MKLYQKKKHFLNFFTFFKSRLNFKRFEKKMTLIAYVFLKLRNVKNVFSLKSPVSEGPLTSNMVNGLKHC